MTSKFKIGDKVTPIDVTPLLGWPDYPVPFNAGKIYTVVEVDGGCPGTEPLIWLGELDSGQNGGFRESRFVLAYESVLYRVEQDLKVSSLNHLNLLGNEIFANAKNKGFWEEGVKPEAFPEKLMLIVSELSEALEEYRNHRGFNETYYNDDKPDKPEGIPIELADALIRLLDTCTAYGIDIDEAVRVKMKYNATRPYKHGGKKV